jgi:pyruvate,orthophosphate dikinase
MFADVVLGADAHAMEQVIDDYKKQHGYANDVEMQAEDWQAVIERFKAMVDFPEDPFVQLRSPSRRYSSPGTHRGPMSIAR